MRGQALVLQALVGVRVGDDVALVVDDDRRQALDFAERGQSWRAGAGHFADQHAVGEG